MVAAFAFSAYQQPLVVVMLGYRRRWCIGLSLFDNSVLLVALVVLFNNALLILVSRSDKDAAFSEVNGDRSPFLYSCIVKVSTDVKVMRVQLQQQQTTKQRFGITPTTTLVIFTQNNERQFWDSDKFLMRNRKTTLAA